ncbi:MAG: hypothetical protein ACP5D2_05310 [Candidatus Nanoarchaeia archaeon]
MKALEKRVKNVNCKDIVMIKLAVLFFTLWFIGLLAYWASLEEIVNWLIEYRWASFALMIIFGSLPFYKCWIKKK